MAVLTVGASLAHSAAAAGEHLVELLAVRLDAHDVTARDGIGVVVHADATGHALGPGAVLPDSASWNLL